MKAFYSIKHLGQTANR